MHLKIRNLAVALINRLFKPDSIEKIEANEVEISMEEVIEEEKELTMAEKYQKAVAGPSKSVKGKDTGISKTVQKAMALYEKSGEVPEILLKLKMALLSIPPSSIEAERTFSTVGIFASKIRSCLKDTTIHSLVVLRQFHKKNE